MLIESKPLPCFCWFLKLKGDIPIDQYIINEDSNPEVITRKITDAIEYVQELAVRYLRPPTPPAPGEIVITMEPNYATGKQKLSFNQRSAMA